MRALARPWPLLVLLAAAGCARASRGPAVPPAALHPQAHSALVGEVDEIVAALGSGEVERIAAHMTPRLHDRLGVADLAHATEQLRDRYGAPQGIMEEHTAREGRLLWYSGLVVFARGRGPREVLTPVLVQLALTPTRQLERLLVREHVFIEHLHAPAEHYLPITRFHVPAEGPWRVAQGGPTRELNAHHGSVTQRFAYDLVRFVDGRFRAPQQPRDRNESFYGYGQPLLAPAGGTVVEVVEGIADNVPGVMGEAGGNGVIIDHGFGEQSSLWHARPGSVRVKVGERVEAGQVVAEVGNSGRSSGPHIHFHLTRRDDPISLPAPFVDLAVDGHPEDLALPLKGQTIESRAQRPAALASGPRVLVDA
ncbi:MAG: M23 family metallopeptidase [Myxococcales bacterium]|nr:M23 family metallopeptidase [Myxococcales bacterium]